MLAPDYFRFSEVFAPILPRFAALWVLWLGASACLAGSAPAEPTVSFVNEVQPVLTKMGCNSGGCHGKATGQNGFKLSLFGFEADEDYEHLVYEQRGRRLVPSAPARSLLLTKGAAIVPHGGGRRLEPGTPGYETLQKWIAQGMPNDIEDPKRPKLESIRVLPESRLMKAGESQALKVEARFSDGRTVDVTPYATMELNSKGMAQLDEASSVLTMGTRAGSVTAMVRYQDRVASFRASLPFGVPVSQLPAERNLVDTAIFKRLKEVGLPPSAVCGDSMFLRRVTLDIASRLPTAEEARKFAADTASDKRARWVEFLLQSDDYADTFANYWSGLMRNRRGDLPLTLSPAHIHGNFAFHSWIRESLYKNKPYDRFVRELLTASGESADAPAATWYRQLDSMLKQTEDTAQLFLGARIQCAQCHHHPYEQWSQRDYYALGAYFAQVERKVSTSRMSEFTVSLKRTLPEAIHKKTGEKVPPGAFGSVAPPLGPDDDARVALADWMTDKANPFFAKALVNRYWKILFNRGLVDPEDDMRDTNPPSHPELLDALAADFVRSGFDLKQLVRTLVNSSAYQLDSTPNAHNADDEQYFSRRYARRLSAEQLADALNSVTGAEDAWANQPLPTRAIQLPDNSYNSVGLLREFGRPDATTACTCERQGSASLGQSLFLATSGEISAKINAGNGTAAKLAADTKRSVEERIEELYLRAYARKPTEKEIVTGCEYVDKVSSKAGLVAPATAVGAWQDLLWALTTSGEFLLNR